MANAVGCPRAASAVACLREKPVRQLLTAGSNVGLFLTSGTSVLPIAPQAAVATGRFARVPVVIGDNRDEGRGFALGIVDWTKAQYVSAVRSIFGADAGKC